MLPKTQYAARQNAEVGREYLVLLRPSSKSLKVPELRRLHSRRLRDQEIIAIVGLRADVEDAHVIAMRMIRFTLILTSLSLLTPIIGKNQAQTPTESNPALRAELLNRVKQTDICLNAS